MRSFIALAYFITLHAAATEAGRIPPPASSNPVYQSFDLQVPHTPVVVPTGTGHRLTYELHLTSFAHVPLALKEVVVVDEDTGMELGRLAGVQLQSAVDVLGASPGVSGASTVEQGRRAVVYIDLPVSGSALRSLRHHVAFDLLGTAKLRSAVMTVAGTAVERRRLLTLGPPLRGGPWVAVYEPGLLRGHRRVIYAVGGRATIPGRHAIDWMRPGAADGTGSEPGVGDGAGAEVLAAADGVVASTRDGVPQPVAGEDRLAISLADATGNFISIQVGAGLYVFYEHLMPGLLVKAGERVKRGQVIARVGSTGQANRPHLHFHLADADSPLGAEGLPYVLEGGTVIGAYESIGAFDAGTPWARTQQLAGPPAMPSPNVVMQFSGSKPDDGGKASGRTTGDTGSALD